MSSRTHRIAEPVPYRAGLTGTHPGQESYIELGRDRVRMVFCWCPPTDGFLMGSPPDEAERMERETLHEVKLTRGLWLAKHPVTQRQWLALMPEKNPSQRGRGDDFPVDSVSWDMTQDFFKRAAEIGVGLCLPTEAQWKYACRAGTRTPFGIGTGDVLNAQVANFNGTYPYGAGPGAFKWLDRNGTTLVGCFPPNAWGLHDMHGQLWEWCADSYSDLSAAKATDPIVDDAGRHRVLRGGSWFYDGRGARAAIRDYAASGLADDQLGFRPCPSSIGQELKEE